MRRSSDSEQHPLPRLIRGKSGDLDLYGKYPPNGAPSRRFFTRLNDGTGRFGAVATHSIATHATDSVSTRLGDFDGRDAADDLAVACMSQLRAKRLEA